MSETMSPETARKIALETLEKLTEERAGTSNRSYNIPAEVRLAAAIELLKFSNTKPESKTSVRPQPGKRIPV